MNKKTQNQKQATEALKKAVDGLRRQLQLTKKDKKGAVEFVAGYLEKALAKSKLPKSLQSRVVRGLTDLYVAVMATYTAEQRHEEDRDTVLAVIAAKLGCDVPDPRVSGALLREETQAALEGAADWVMNVIESAGKRRANKKGKR